MLAENLNLYISHVTFVADVEPGMVRIHRHATSRLATRKLHRLSLT